MQLRVSFKNCERKTLSHAAVSSVMSCLIYLENLLFTVSEFPSKSASSYSFPEHFVQLWKKKILYLLSLFLLGAQSSASCTLG